MPAVNSSVCCALTCMSMGGKNSSSGFCCRSTNSHCWASVSWLWRCYGGVCIGWRGIPRYHASQQATPVKCHPAVAESTKSRGRITTAAAAAPLQTWPFSNRCALLVFNLLGNKTTAPQPPTCDGVDTDLAIRPLLPLHVDVPEWGRGLEVCVCVCGGMNGRGVSCKLLGRWPQACSCLLELPEAGIQRQ